MDIAPKTSGAVAGGSVSISVVTLIDWALSYWHISMPAAVAASLATLFAAAGAYIAPRSHAPPEIQPPQNP